MESHPIGNVEAVSIRCPHCGWAEPDDLEAALAYGRQTLFCGHCSQRFGVSLMECQSCGAECLFSWKLLTAIDAAERLACFSCGRRYVDDEVPADDACILS
jgi:hypothetical protein